MRYFFSLFQVRRQSMRVNQITSRKSGDLSADLGMRARKRRGTGISAEIDTRERDVWALWRHLIIGALGVSG